MLYRKVENDIKEWIKSDNKASLLISGVRQSGKTTIIRSVLEKENVNYVEFNFINQPEIVKTLKNNEGSGAKRILAILSAFTDRETQKGSIFFFDEVQVYKEILTMIKFLAEEGSFRYILSGSLLGIELRDLRSAPVGYLREIQMYPMDFEEFLYASSGVREDLINIMKESFTLRKPLQENVHDKMMEHFFNYLLVGGMPKAVQAFVDKNDFSEVSKVHQEIYPEYKRDFTQYESDNKKLRIIDAYDLIPSELNEKNKRFVISDIDKKLKYNSIEDSINWLIHAGVAIPTYNVKEPRIPLLINKQHNLFKLFLSDVGMLTTMFGSAARISILNKDGSVNCGAVYENYVAQELNAHNYNLYYFNSKKQGEIDFVIENDMHCLPIEVKSGKDYTRHSALNRILANKEYNIRQAYVLCNDNLSVDDNVVYLPIYMTMFIK